MMKSKIAMTNGGRPECYAITSHEKPYLLQHLKQLLPSFFNTITMSPKEMVTQKMTIILMGTKLIRNDAKAIKHLMTFNPLAFSAENTGEFLLIGTH